MFRRENVRPHATIWHEAPVPAIPDMPATLSDASSLWLAYATTSEPCGSSYAVVQFADVIDHRLSPINDEGLGQHRYAAAGLKWYGFNEILNSEETQRWRTLGARHWVVTFKDGTLDVVAASAKVLTENVKAPSPVAALLSVIASEHHAPGSAAQAAQPESEDTGRPLGDPR